jgi:hypothetical protein
VQKTFIDIWEWGRFNNESKKAVWDEKEEDE